MLPYTLSTVTPDDAILAGRQQVQHSNADLRLSDHNDDKHAAAEQQDEHGLHVTQCERTVSWITQCYTGQIVNTVLIMPHT